MAGENPFSAANSYPNKISFSLDRFSLKYLELIMNHILLKKIN